MLTIQNNPGHVNSTITNINPKVNSEKVIGKFYVGNYFTERGQFYEVSYCKYNNITYTYKLLN